MDGTTVERLKKRKRWEVVALARLGVGWARLEMFLVLRQG